MTPRRSWRLEALDPGALFRAIVLAHALAAAATAALPSPGQSEMGRWLRHARLASVSFSQFRVTNHEIACELEDLIWGGATVVRVAGRSMDTPGEKEFARDLDVARRVARDGDLRNVLVLWEVPLLEVVTAEGRVDRDSIARVHPDWLMTSFDRHSRAVSYPRRPPGAVHRDEVAAMCPHGPYRQFLLDRLKRLAATGVDGIWLSSTGLDAPGVFWACADTRCRARFEQDTGLRFPSSVDLSDARFRRYVAWRHDTLARLLADCARAVHSVDPRLAVVADSPTIDTGEAARHGVDGSAFGDVIPAWHVGSISSTTAMADASVDDWLGHMAAYRFCRAASEPGPAWAYCSGYRAEDVELVLAECIAAQVNPHEHRGSQTGTSTARYSRRRMYDWLRDNASRVYDSRSIASVAILFSTESRDLVDGLRTGGQFSTWARPRRDLDWYAGSPRESACHAEFVGEYRGWAKVLIRSGIPFDVVLPRVATPERLASYRCVIVPEGAALSDRTRQTLEAWNSRGGTLIVTGRHSGQFDETGTRRRRNLWDGVSVAGGRVLRTTRPLGRDALKGERAATETARGWLASAGAVPVVVDGQPVYTQCYQLDTETIVHAVNYGWVGHRKNAPDQVTATFQVPIPEGGTGNVTLLVPDEEPVGVAATVSQGFVRFACPVGTYAMFVVR